LSYNNHYFWWRPSGARVFRDNVFIQQKYERSRREQEKKRKRKERQDQKKKKKKK
jgi:hypothetical protein